MPGEAAIVRELENIRSLIVNPIVGIFEEAKTQTNFLSSIFEFKNTL